MIRHIYGLVFLFMGCATQPPSIKLHDRRLDFDEKGLDEGIAAYHQSDYTYQKDGKNIFKISFGEPVVVAVADKPYKWGFFQFPGLYTSDEGEIVARWNMAHDNAESYGKGGNGFAVSKDKGKTWTQTDRHPIGGGLALKSGEYINVHTPQAIPMKDLHLPDPIATVRKLMGVHLGFGKRKTYLKNCRVYTYKGERKGAANGRWNIMTSSNRIWSGIPTMIYCR